MPNNDPVDPKKVEAFAGKAFGDVSGGCVLAMCALGDRLGLFKNLDAEGPATSAQLAARTACNERYVKEWLGGMVAAGYLEYDPANETFSMPAEHAPTLAHEGGATFLGGMYAAFPLQLGVLDGVEKSFREGGGVCQEEYDTRVWNALDRGTRSWHDNLLVQEWIPAMPVTQAKLESGASMADVGCGSGRAVVRLAQAFPRSHFVGFDVYEPTIELAKSLAKEAGVADRVRFEAADISHGLSGTHDVVSTFDVVHDAVDPAGMLKAIRRSLKDDGVFACLEINASDKLEENVGPMGTLFHYASIFYCMTTSLCHGGAGLGPLGLHEAALRAACEEAGFANVRVAWENPFNKLFEVTA